MGSRPIHLTCLYPIYFVYLQGNLKSIYFQGWLMQICKNLGLKIFDHDISFYITIQENTENLM